MWARIHNGIVAEITSVDPTGRFHALLSWVPCPPGTAVGYTWNGTTFAPPPSGAPAPAPRVPLRLVAQRLKDVGLWPKFAQAVDNLAPEQRLGLLWEQSIPADDRVLVALLAGVGANPKVILA